MTGGGERLAKEMDVPFLGRIPIDFNIAASGDAGMPYIERYPDTATGRAFAEVIRPILEGSPTAGSPLCERKEEHMRIAIPMAAGKLSQHFGHCERFALIDVDQANKKIIDKQELESPEHQPGLLPHWLAEKGVTVVIAGGMGESAQKLFSECGIRVLIGAPAEAPETLVEAFMAGTLKTGGNQCDH